MVFENVAQRRQEVFLLERGMLRLREALALDHVAAPSARDVHQVRPLQFFNEIGETGRSVGALVEGGIELQHGGLQQPQLRLDSTTF